MKRNTYLAIFLGLACTGLISGLILNSIQVTPKAPIQATYLDAQVDYIKTLAKKGEYYKVDQAILSEVKKIDFTSKDISKKSNFALNELEDRISEAEDKLRLAIYAKTHTVEQNQQAQALFTKAWVLNRQMHQAVKENKKELIQELEKQFQTLETPLAIEVLNIVVPEPILN